ncbi:MAG TPA: hypothetical protein VLE95_02760 [Chlamydiales bacterium]|nr:hypothetical protein [Chlamydiales bacterium]
MHQDLPTFFQRKLSILDRFIDRRWIAAIGTVFAGIAVLIFSFHSSPKAPDFAFAEILVAKWIALPEDGSLFQEMSKALRKVPTLQKKYEPVIAQKLMEGGRGAEALQIAYRSIDLARSEVPYHAHFAETSLVIERGDYQQALLSSVTLKEKMTRECNIDAFWGEHPKGGSLLFAHNLLRIACLQQELKNRPGEMAAWIELESLLKNHENSPTAYLLVSSFQEKGLDLTHYITERKSFLQYIQSDAKIGA